MKRKIMIAVVAVLCALTTLVLVACGGAENKLVKVGGMSDLVTELKAGSIDIGIIDKVMADYLMGMESTKKLQVIEDLVFADEQYGIGFRKGDLALTEKVNGAIGTLSKNGKLDAIASNYNLSSAMLPYNYDDDYDAIEDKSSWTKIEAKGKMVIGYTLFPPIAFKDAADKLIGFDIDFARAVCAELGITAEFIEITWRNKEIELDAGNIDCVWNGMTIKDSLKASMAISVPYMMNKQVALIRIADAAKYTKDLATFKGAYIGVEDNSAGESIYNTAILPKIQ